MTERRPHLSSIDFGATFEHEVSGHGLGLALPPPTEMIRIPSRDQMLDERSVLVASQGAKSAIHWQLRLAARTAARSLGSALDDWMFGLRGLRRRLRVLAKLELRRLRRAARSLPEGRAARSIAAAGERAWNTLVPALHRLVREVQAATVRVSAPMWSMILARIPRSSVPSRVEQCPRTREVVRRREVVRLGVNASRSAPLAVHPKRILLEPVGISPRRASPLATALRAITWGSAIDDLPTCEIHLKTGPISVVSGDHGQGDIENVLARAPAQGASLARNPPTSTRSAPSAASPSSAHGPAASTASTAWAASTASTSPPSLRKEAPGQAKAKDSSAPAKSAVAHGAAPVHHPVPTSAPLSRPLPRLPSKSLRAHKTEHVRPPNAARRVAMGISPSLGIQRTVACDTPVLMRADPSAPVAGEISRGTPVFVLDRHAPKGWFFVKGPGGASGYVRERVLTD